MLRNKSEINGRIISEDASIIKKYANTYETLFMTMDEAIALSREIAYRVSALSEQPEIIICISNGAELLSRVNSSILHIPIENLTIQRKGTILQKKLSIVPGLVSLISQWYQVPVLNIPLRYIMRQLSSLSKISHQLTPIIHKRNTLLLDDVIETGQTFIAAKKILHDAGAHSITTAVLAWADDNKLNQEEIMRPDIFIGRRVQYYPWSRNSPYWHEHKSWIEQKHVKGKCC